MEVATSLYRGLRLIQIGKMNLCRDREVINACQVTFDVVKTLSLHISYIVTTEEDYFLGLYSQNACNKDVSALYVMMAGLATYHTASVICDMLAASSGSIQTYFATMFMQLDLCYFVNEQQMLIFMIRALKIIVDPNNNITSLETFNEAMQLIAAVGNIFSINVYKIHFTEMEQVTGLNQSVLITSGIDH